MIDPARLRALRDRLERCRQHCITSDSTNIVIEVLDQLLDLLVSPDGREDVVQSALHIGQDDADVVQAALHHAPLAAETPPADLVQFWYSTNSGIPVQPPPACYTAETPESWRDIRTAPTDDIVLVHDDGYVGKGLRQADGRWLDVECGRDDAFFNPLPTEWMALPAPPVTQVAADPRVPALKGPHESHRSDAAALPRDDEHQHAHAGEGDRPQLSDAESDRARASDGHAQPADAARVAVGAVGAPADPPRRPVARAVALITQGIRELRSRRPADPPKEAP